METICLEHSKIQFRNKPFLANVHTCPFAMKLYLLHPKDEPLVLASVCNLISYTGYINNVLYKDKSFSNAYSSLDDIVNKVKDYYRSSAQLCIDKYNIFNYHVTLQNTIVCNWDYFNPSIRKTLEYKFKNGKITKLN